MAEREDPSVLAPQAAFRDPPPDPMTVDARLRKLLGRDPTMLRRGFASNSVG